MRESRSGMCLMCSMGCDFAIETRAGEPVGLEYVAGSSGARGKLCSKGNYLFDLVQCPFRIIEPRTADGPLSWRDAIGFMARRFEPGLHDGSVGLIVEGDASVEDILACRLFADKCAGTPWFAVRFATGDDQVVKVLHDVGAQPGRVDAGVIESAAVVLAIGDPFELSPVIAGPVLRAKYAARRNVVITVSPEPNRTSAFSSKHLCISERAVCADVLRAIVERADAKDVTWAEAVRRSRKMPDDPAVGQVAELLATRPSVIITATQDPVTAGLAALISQAAGGVRGAWWLMSYGNAGDILAVEDESAQVAEVIGAVASGRVKSLVVLGSDLSRNNGWEELRGHLEKLDFLAVGSPFESELTELADVVLPTALWCETEGTLNGALREAVVPPPGGALSYGDIVRRLISNMGVRIESPQPAAKPVRGPVTAEQVEELLARADADGISPLIRSTTTRYGDGFLTGMSRFVRSQGVAAG